MVRGFDLPAVLPPSFERLILCPRHPDRAAMRLNPTLGIVWCGVCEANGEALKIGDRPPGRG